MTSNQIAFAQTLEARRHNLETEELTEQGQNEVQRHNLAVEALNKEANALEQERIQNEKTYRSESLATQKAINNIEVAYKYASLSYQKVLDQEKLALQDKQINLDAMFQQANTLLKAQMNDLERRKQDEVKRHNLAAEDLANYTATTDYWFKSMSLDYNQRKLEIESGLRREELEDARAKVGADIYFKNASLELERQRNQAAIALSNAEAVKTVNESRWLPFDMFFKGVGNAAKAGALLYGTR